MTAHVLGVTNNAMVNLGRHTAQIRHTPFLTLGKRSKGVTLD